MTKRNTAMKVKSEKREGFWRDYGDGSAAGLYLQVSRSPTEKRVTRSWVFRFTSPITAKRRWMGLGPADAIGLAKARDLARAARDQVLLGNDPIVEREATRNAKREAHLREIASTMTFRECADEYLAEHRRASATTSTRRNGSRASLAPMSGLVISMSVRSTLTRS